MASSCEDLAGRGEGGGPRPFVDLGTIIRPWASTDCVASLTAMLHRAYARLGRLGFNYTATDQDDAVTLERIASGSCFVAVTGGKLSGTILFKQAGQTAGCSWYDRPDVASFSQFAVDPEYQGLGIGHDLLAFVEDLAVRSGAAELALDTAEGAAHLVRWYGQAGYVAVDRLQWPGKTYHSLVMSKPLGSG